MAGTYVDCSHNVEFSLNEAKWKPDVVKSGEGDITGYQEAEGTGPRTVIKDYCIAHNRGRYHPTGSGNAISWKRELFRPVVVNKKKVNGMIQSHLGAIAMGIDVKYNPARDFTYVGLLHKETGKKILRVNVHPIAGATKPESAAANTDSDALSVYKDWAVGQYWLDILSFVSAQMSLQDPGTKTMTNFWDVISLGGDYNAALNDKDRWYYPGALLPALFEPDEQLRGLDHLQVAHGSDTRPGHRWAVDANSDHQIHFIERTFVDVADFPRQF
jgi:hypothetical protein